MRNNGRTYNKTRSCGSCKTTPLSFSLFQVIYSTIQSYIRMIWTSAHLHPHLLFKNFFFIHIKKKKKGAPLPVLDYHPLNPATHSSSDDIRSCEMEQIFTIKKKGSHAYTIDREAEAWKRPRSSAQIPALYWLSKSRKSFSVFKNGNRAADVCVISDRSLALINDEFLHNMTQICAKIVQEGWIRIRRKKKPVSNNCEG